VAAALVVCCLSCTSGQEAAQTPAAPPAPAAIEALNPYYGSYATDDGDTLVVARLGWYFDMRDSAYRTIYATASPNRFTIGQRFAEPLPKFAELTFGQGTLTVNTRRARRIENKPTDVTIHADGADLAATITEPPSAGPHPGIVVVHGSERGQRFFYDIWVGVYTSLGLTVLTYDKRGGGSSTGTYPGEFPSEDSLKIYADDASAAQAFLARWPGVNTKRVGFHGGSQGGWTVPLAMLRHPQAAFAVLVSAPATTVDQTDLWSSFSGGGGSMPAQSVAEMQAAVRANHGGYDPTAALQALSVPALWLLGSNDRTVPTANCVEILNGMRKPNFTIKLLPTGHGLLVNPTGLNADDNHSPGLAPDLVPDLRDWMRAASIR
jgi:dienelactone hydrolase